MAGGYPVTVPMQGAGAAMGLAGGRAVPVQATNWATAAGPGAGGASGPREHAPGRSFVSPPRVSAPFLGLNTEADPARLHELETPWAVNFDGVTVPGSLAVRRGIAKLKYHASESDAEGISAHSLNFDIGGDAVMLFVTESTGNAVLFARTQRLDVPRTSTPRVPPAVTLSSAGGSIDIEVAADATGSGMSHVFIAWSTRGYPLCQWVEADLNSDDGQVLEAEWNGATAYEHELTEDDFDAIEDGQRVYVSVWTSSRLGFSPAWRGTVNFAE